MTNRYFIIDEFILSSFSEFALIAVLQTNLTYHLRNSEKKETKYTQKTDKKYTD